MEQDVFVGMGHNPQGPDLPVGFGMQLAQVPSAVATYGRMTDAQREAVVRYVQAGATGDEAEQRVAEAVRRLAEGNVSF